MYGDPITWSMQERIARCREQADIFQQMADADNRFIGRDGLIDGDEKCGSDPSEDDRDGGRFHGRLYRKHSGLKCFSPCASR